MTVSTTFDDPVFLEAMAVLRGKNHQAWSLPQSPADSNTTLPSRFSAALHSMQSIAEVHLTKLRGKVLKHTSRLPISQVTAKLVAHVKTSVSRGRQTRTQRHPTRSATSSGNSSDGSDTPPAPIQCLIHLCYSIVFPCCTVNAVTPSCSDTSPPQQPTVTLYRSATAINRKYTFRLIVLAAIAVYQFSHFRQCSEVPFMARLSPPSFHFSQIGADPACCSSSMGAAHE